MLLFYIFRETFVWATFHGNRYSKRVMLLPFDLFVIFFSNLTSKHIWEKLFDILIRLKDGKTS